MDNLMVMNLRGASTKTSSAETQREAAHLLTQNSMNASDRRPPCRRGAGIMNCMLSNPSSSIRSDVLSELCNARNARAMCE